MFDFLGFLKKKDYNFRDAGLVEIFGQQPTFSGVAVNATTALNVPAVNIAVRVISEAVASLPLHLFKRDGDVKIRDTENPLYRIVHSQPNAWSSSYDFRLQMHTDVLLTGNAYAFANRVDGTVRELVRLLPSSVTVTAGSDGEPVYRIKNKAGGEQTYTFDQILHLKGMSLDGLVGTSPVHFAREAIGLAISLEQSHASLHANGAQPGGVLSVKGKLDAAAKDRLKTAWQGFQGGVANRFKTAVLDVDAEWKPLAMTGVDTQHLETRRFQIDEIARAFKVPPNMIYEMGRATWGNSEVMGQLFLDSTLMAWLKLWEGALTRVLLTPEERLDHYFEHDTNALTRADTQVRTAAYKSAVGGAYLTANEVRALENRAPIEGGDVLNPPVGASRFEEPQPSSKSFNPNQPRAANGQFGSGGNSNVLDQARAAERAYNAGSTASRIGSVAKVALVALAAAGSAKLVAKTAVKLFGTGILSAKKSTVDIDSMSDDDLKVACESIIENLSDEQRQELLHQLTKPTGANDNEPRKTEQAA